MVESFILQTDQKPLVSIFRKHMIDVSPRIQRITIRAWQYDFVPQHIPGRINVIADSLSRVTPLEFQNSNAEKDILAVNFLQYSSVEERERDEVLQETNKDKELQSLKHYISTGWPAKRSQIPVFLHPYWNYRDELTVESGILMPHPWHTLSSDLFYFQRIDFLVVVDYFSKYLIVRKIPNSTSSAVIKELGMIFSGVWKATGLQK